MQAHSALVRIGHGHPAKEAMEPVFAQVREGSFNFREAAAARKQPTVDAVEREERTAIGAHAPP